MRTAICLLLGSIILQFCGCDPGTPGLASLKVMSFNLRVDLVSDGENAWPARKEIAASLIRFHEPQLLGVQEAMQGQVQDLAARLPEYDWVGVGRDDGHAQGEYMAIFYARERLVLLDHGTFWLSETPDQPGKGWDADWIRTATWAKFRDRVSQQIFIHINTHLDNRGEQARQKGARLVRDRINELSQGQIPVVLTGDFNTQPGTRAYEILTSNTNPAELPLYDSGQISEMPHYGPQRTFTGFDLETLKQIAPPIDFIFVSSGITVKKHATLSDSVDGRLPSDHFPVLVEMTIKD